MDTLTVFKPVRHAEMHIKAKGISSESLSLRIHREMMEISHCTFLNIERVQGIMDWLHYTLKDARVNVK